MRTKPNASIQVHEREAAWRGAQPSTQRSLVPFITRWSGERNSAMPVVARRDRRGIAYADERSFDRDGNGILWTRTPSQPGKGKPEFGRVHSLRQRLCMSELRCQICGGPADRTADGVLWLVDAHADELVRGYERTAHPPVCLPCALWSVQACPHLGRAWVALRVRAFAHYGVSGTLYQPGQPTPVAVDAAVFPFGDPRLPWVRAGQLLITLRHFSVLDLAATGS